MLKFKYNLATAITFIILLTLLVGLGILSDYIFSLFNLNTHHLGTLFLLSSLYMVELWDSARHSVIQARLEQLKNEHSDISSDVSELPDPRRDDEVV